MEGIKLKVKHFDWSKMKQTIHGKVFSLEKESQNVVENKVFRLPFSSLLALIDAVASRVAAIGTNLTRARLPAHKHS